MKRTTIFLTETLERQLRAFAKGQEKPVAEVVREALARHLDGHRPRFRLPPTFDSGRSDIATRFDEFLFQDFDIHGGSTLDAEPPKE